MNANVLGLLIKAKIDTLSEQEKLIDVKVWTAVSQAIIDHIQMNAEIVPGSIQSSGTGNLGSPVVSMNTTTGLIQ